ncbi:hypothetical protein [Pseudonocardia sp.]|nr:hypothetical protein [Pseudonocardia sp.]
MGELRERCDVVETHVSNIPAKLGLNNRVQIALLVHDAALSDDPQ